MNMQQPSSTGPSGSRATRLATIVCGVGAAIFVGIAAILARPSDAPPDPAIVREHQALYRRASAVPYPAANARTADREHLGRVLFFDPRLSGSNTISCATCHNPGLAWGDGRARAIGSTMQPLERRTPTILNLAWSTTLFWDGRAESLEEQALGPIAAPGEMNLKLEEMVRRLQSIEGYRPLFARAYPGEAISSETVAKALATFERGIVSGEAPFDRWTAGDAKAISPSAQRGFVLFNTKARCSTCHTGWRFTDDGFYDIGVASDDVGRAKVMPAIALARFAFKTPTLRNVAERAPYFHDGSARTLEDVIALYDRGGVVRRPSLSPEIKPLGLTPVERQDLAAFLQTLTSKDLAIGPPALPH